MSFLSNVKPLPGKTVQSGPTPVGSSSPSSGSGFIGSVKPFTGNVTSNAQPVTSTRPIATTQVQQPSRSYTQIAFDTAKKLIAGGIDGALSDAPAPVNLADTYTQAVQQRKQMLDDLSPTFETDAKGKVTGIKSGGNAGDVATNFSPMGALGSAATKIGKEVLEKIAKTKEAKVIADELTKLRVPKQKIDTLSDILTVVDNPKVVEVILLPEIQLPGALAKRNTAEAVNQAAERAKLNVVNNAVDSVAAKTEKTLASIPREVASKIKPLEKIVVEAGETSAKKVTLLDYVRTPDRVWEKIGFGKEFTDLRVGYEKYAQELIQTEGKINNWHNQVSKESNEKIFKHLDGEFSVLNDTEQAVANEIKDFLKVLADRLGLPEDKRVSSYITHLFDKELKGKEVPEELKTIFTDKIQGSVYDPYLQSRLGVKGYKQDTWAALDAYAQKALKKVNLDNALSQIQAKTGSSFELKKIEESQFKFIKRALDAINLKPTELDNLIENAGQAIYGDFFGAAPIKAASRVLRQLSYLGGLGGNVGSAMRNLSQGINTYAKLGEKYTAIGYLKLFSKDSINELRSQGILADSFIEDRVLQTSMNLVKKADKALFALFQSAEYINRGAAYFGAKAKAISKGLPEEEAVKFAKKTVRDTQFAFTPIDSPIGLRSDVLRTAFQFQTYTVKQIEFLTEMVKNKDVVGLARYGAGGFAFVYALGDAFGMEPSQLIPSFRFETPPVAKVPVELAKAAFNSPDKYGRERDLETKVRDIAKSAVGTIPGGVQAKKTIEGIKSIRDGGSFDKGENLQFEQDQTLAGKAQAVIFGKNSSQNAKNYFDRTKNNKKEAKSIQPIYDKIQSLKEKDMPEAKRLYNTLTAEQKEVYKKLKTNTKTKETAKAKKDILPTFQKIRGLVESGKREEASRVYNELSPEQKKAYQLVKKKLD